MIEETDTEIETPETISARKQTLLEDKRHTSSQISNLARYIGFGLAAVTFALLSSDSSFASGFVSRFQTWVVISAGLGCLAVILDYFHYLLGYHASSMAAGDAQANYKFIGASVKLRKWRYRFFWYKQIIAIAGAVIFVILIIFNIAVPIMTSDYS